MVGSAKAVVVRLYEAFGSRTSATLTSQLPFKAAQRYMYISPCNSVNCNHAHMCKHTGAIS